MSEIKKNAYTLALSKLKRKNQPLQVTDYLNGIQLGDRNILAQAITLIESSNSELYDLGQSLVELSLPHSGHSLRIGITGVPGVGKSTFIEAFGKKLIDDGKKIAVLAIDPSSQKTGGSILGDKTRMEDLAHNPHAFIRPTPASDALGGVARKTRETIILCEAAGFDTILIETVGVGQSEIEVKSMVDYFLLLMLAGAGDELQGIKRGIMEMADGIIITKVDQGNEQAAKNAQRNYKNALHLFPPNQNNWIPTVSLCSSLENKGIDEIWQTVQSFENSQKINGWFNENRKNQSLAWMHQTIEQTLQRNFRDNPLVKSQINAVEAKVILGEIGPFKAAEMLLALLKNS